MVGVVRALFLSHNLLALSEFFAGQRIHQVEVVDLGIEGSSGAGVLVRLKVP